jgi:hypothetical protein
MCKVILVAGLVAIMTYPALGQSHDPSIGSGNIDRTVITAPVGHRQPRAVDVPATNVEDNGSAYARDRKLDRVLRICRGC